MSVEECKGCHGSGWPGPRGEGHPCSQCGGTGFKEKACRCEGTVIDSNVLHGPNGCYFSDPDTISEVTSLRASNAALRKERDEAQARVLRAVSALSGDLLAAEADRDRERRWKEEADKEWFGKLQAVEEELKSIRAKTLNEAADLLWKWCRHGNAVWAQEWGDRLRALAKEKS